MLRIIAETLDNRVAKKFEEALRTRSYTTSGKKMERVKTILRSPKEELFRLKMRLPVEEISPTLQQIGEGADHRVYRFAFPSPHPTTDEVNNTVYGKLYQSRSNPKAATILILPGWMTYKEEKYYTQPLGRMLLDAGYNYIFYSLPYHMERTPKGCLSGELAISGNLYRTVESFRQALLECRTIIAWLNEVVQAERVGVLGLSLGGWLASHLVHLDCGIDFAVLMVPAVNPTAGLWQTRIAAPIRRDLIRMGFTAESYRELIRPIDPVNYCPVLDPHKVLVVGALFDQCAPFDALEAYCRFLGNPQRLNYRHSHFSIMHSVKPIEGIIQFIRNQM